MSQCLDRFRLLLHENNLDLPKPHLGLAQMSQNLPQLPKLPRLDQLPKPALPLHLPKLPLQLPKLPEELPRLPQQLPQLPQQLTNLPQRTRQCFVNVRNRLNTLKPQPEQQDA